MEETNYQTNHDLKETPVKLWSFRFGVFLTVRYLLALLELVGWGLARAQCGQVQSGQVPDFIWMNTEYNSLIRSN